MRKGRSSGSGASWEWCIATRSEAYGVQERVDRTTEIQLEKTQQEKSDYHQPAIVGGRNARVDRELKESKMGRVESGRGSAICTLSSLGNLLIRPDLPDDPIDL